MWQAQLPLRPSKRNGDHGPSWAVTRALRGKTVNRTFPEPALAEVREQIAEYRRFKALSAELIEVSTRICDARLRMKQASPETAAAEKGGSKKRSRRRSSRKGS